MVDLYKITEKYSVLAFRYFFAGHTFISGINHYIEIFPDRLTLASQSGHSLTSRFLNILVDSGIYDLCKIIEIVVGLALILGLFVPLALIIEVPVSAIIFYMDVFMSATPRTIFTGWREILINFGLLAAYWGYFRPIFLQPILPLKPVWRDPFFGGKSESRQ